MARAARWWSADAVRGRGGGAGTLPRCHRRALPRYPGESGLVVDHRAVVGAVRAAAMAQADLVITVGGSWTTSSAGSPAVFPDARFLRIADTTGELVDNRRGTPEILAGVDLALEALAVALGVDAGARTRTGRDGARETSRLSVQKGASGRYRRPARMVPSIMAIFDALDQVVTRKHRVADLGTSSASFVSG